MQDKSLSISAPVVDCDTSFLAILDGMISLVQRSTAESASHILEVSAQFLSKDATDTLSKFHALYFSNNRDLEATKLEIDQEVTAIFESAQRMTEATAEVVSEPIGEDFKVKDKRLGLAALQKELEGIISLERGIRDRLYPVLAQLQFEDHLRQRLMHVADAWHLIARTFAVEGETAKKPLGTVVLKLLSSNAERRLYYDLVLKQEPPADCLADEDTISGLFDE